MTVKAIYSKYTILHVVLRNRRRKIPRSHEYYLLIYDLNCYYRVRFAVNFSCVRVRQPVCVCVCVWVFVIIRIFVLLRDEYDIMIST